MESSLEYNNSFFLKLETKLKKKQSFKLAKQLISAAMTGGFGVSYSEVLERFFIDYSKKKIKLTSCLDNTIPLPNSILHVMTEAYLFGGHTRIVERWIQSADVNETHSVVILNQKNKNKIPNKLFNVTNEKSGNVFVFKNSLSLFKKIKKLYELGMKYETIVLHHHPDDYIPLMTFSSKDFIRPVICFNHSGHTFWIGSSIVDLCIDIEKNQNETTLLRRSVKNQVLLNMPVDSFSKNQQEQSGFLETIGVPRNMKVLGTMASMYKYTRLGDVSFCEYLRIVFQKNLNIVFVGIGVKEEGIEWVSLKKDFPKQVFLLGNIPHEDINEIISCFDLYVDSFPFNSWVSLIDILNKGNCPVLVLKTPVGYPPYLENTSAICEDLDDLIEKTILLLVDKEKHAEFRECVYERFVVECSLGQFALNVKDVVTKVKKMKFSSKIYFKDVVKTFSEFDEYNYLFRKSTSKRIVLKEKSKFLIKKTNETLFKTTTRYILMNVVVLKNVTRKIPRWFFK